MLHLCQEEMLFLEANGEKQMKFHEVVIFLLLYHLLDTYGYIYCFWFYISLNTMSSSHNFSGFQIVLGLSHIVNDKLLIKCKMKDQITHILQLK